MEPEKLTIYYDGACHICSREIERYKKKDRGQRLHLVDIADPHFDAAREGLDLEAVQQAMHVRLQNGAVRTGVDAFLAIWQELPGYAGFTWLLSNPVLKPFFKLGYRAFARFRIYLPKRRHAACTDEHCKFHRA